MSTSERGMSTTGTPIVRDRTQCARCGTELSLQAVACPACGTLVYGDKLRELAAHADEATAAADLVRARESWEEALRLLPPDSQQSTIIQRRVAELTKRIDAEAAASGKPKPKREGNFWQRGGALLITVVLLLVGKLKFLLLGLTKASTFLSMFAFFGVYWGMFGWPLAAGLVVSIYIHEMGHVAMLRRLGIASGAPLFIPGVGALVMLKQRVDDPIKDAQIGLAGPVWGLGAALAALAIHQMTDDRIWLAIAQLTGFINLFNLIPIWQLDGSRGFHALSRADRWLAVGAIGLTLYLTEQRLLFIVGGVAVWRAMQREVGPGDRRVLATYAALVGALSWIAMAVK